MAILHLEKLIVQCINPDYLAEDSNFLLLLGFVLLIYTFLGILLFFRGGNSSLDQEIVIEDEDVVGPLNLPHNSIIANHNNSAKPLCNDNNTVYKDFNSEEMICYLLLEQNQFYQSYNISNPTELKEQDYENKIVYDFTLSKDLEFSLLSFDFTKSQIISKINTAITVIFDNRVSFMQRELIMTRCFEAISALCEIEEFVNVTQINGIVRWVVANCFDEYGSEEDSNNNDEEYEGINDSRNFSNMTSSSLGTAESFINGLATPLTSPVDQALDCKVFFNRTVL